MKKLLYIEGSPRKDRSHSIKIANEYLKKVAENDNNIEIKTIDLWSLDLPEFNGDMSIDELLNAGLTGSAVYAASDVAISCLNSSAAGCGGSYDVTDTWNFASGTITQSVTNGTAAIDYNGNGTIDANIGFALTSTLDYTSGGPLGGSITTTDSQGPIPAYFHVSTEVDTSLSVVGYGMSQTEAHISNDIAVNGYDWTSQAGSTVSVTDQGGTTCLTTW